MESGSSYLQGLYPISEHLGYSLTEEQKELAYPPGNISEDVQKAVNDLDVAALPYKMTLAPVRVIGDNDGEINVYAFDSCIEKMNEIRQQNNEISQLKDYIKNFNEKYAVNWNKYFNKETAEFDFNEISSICDAFLSNDVEKKEMKEFKEKSGINFDELKEDCFDFFGKDFLYSFHGDKDKIYTHSDSSNILREELYFMKRRLDTDITPENEDANLKDFSRPKMLMYSGHDSTITDDIILILYALGINATELYYYPRYASQLSLEVRTSKSNAVIILIIIYWDY